MRIQPYRSHSCPRRFASAMGGLPPSRLAAWMSPRARRPIFELTLKPVFGPFTPPAEAGSGQPMVCCGLASPPVMRW